ncbi:MAG: hypothetical protein ACREDE_01655 [Thermoplasmata archaeon]
MGSRHVGDVLSVLRQGLTLGVQFGAHSVEALLWIAETVEEGVYEPGSLHGIPGGISFALDNPLLRVGAFTHLAVLVDGAPVAGALVRFRRGAGAVWRTANSLGAGSTWDLAPGDRTEFEVQGAFGANGAPLTVRLELHTPAIPPLVWFEFTEHPSALESGP